MRAGIGVCLLSDEDLCSGPPLIHLKPVGWGWGCQPQDDFDVFHWPWLQCSCFSQVKSLRITAHTVMAKEVLTFGTYSQQVSDFPILFSQPVRLRGRAWVLSMFIINDSVYQTSPQPYLSSGMFGFFVSKIKDKSLRGVMNRRGKYHFYWPDCSKQWER